MKCNTFMHIIGAKSKPNKYHQVCEGNWKGGKHHTPLPSSYQGTELKPTQILTGQGAMIFEVGREEFGSFMCLSFLSGKTEMMGKGQNNRTTAILSSLFSFTLL